LRFKAGILILIAVLSVNVLAGCESSEQKAERHFQSALVLLESGDEKRAILEFRNVLRLNPRHHKARAAYGALLRRRGDLSGALAQYVYMAEQFPDDLSAQQNAAELDALTGKWKEMAPFLSAAERLAPNDPATRALRLIYRYQMLGPGTKPDIRRDIAARASALLEQLPDDILLYKVVIDSAIRDGRPKAALAALDRAIARAPDDKTLYMARLSVLADLGDTAGIERQLAELADRFPDDRDARNALVQWYVSQGRQDDAERVLRATARRTGALDDRLRLVRFLADTLGTDAALNALDGMDSQGSDAIVLTGLRAGLLYEKGRRDEARAALRAALDGAPPSDAERKARMILAEILDDSGDEPGARAAVAQVLSEDEGNVDALKMQARWQIQDDRIADAVASLRTALNRAPRDVEVLTLLARAHERAGNRDLAGEMLALALDASNNAPAQAVAYADELIRQDRTAQAEGVLKDSLRLHPDNEPLLERLGALYVAALDWPRARQVQEKLASLPAPTARARAAALKLQILRGQGRHDEAMSLLHDLASSQPQGAGASDARVALVRSYIERGELDKARQEVARLRADAPDDGRAILLEAAVDVAAGRPEAAERALRDTLGRDPAQLQAWVALYRLKLLDGAPDSASRVLASALEALPDNRVLLWMRAGELEHGADPQGAIAIYERLYAEDSSDPIIANNLASLLSSTHTDARTIERAATIARRLRYSREPAFQDTYGWIALLQGNIDEAIRTLEPAAAGLPDDPGTQYHLARAYLAKGRKSEALERFRKVLSLVGPDAKSDLASAARDAISRLDRKD